MDSKTAEKRNERRDYFKGSHVTWFSYMNENILKSLRP